MKIIDRLKDYITKMNSRVNARTVKLTTPKLRPLESMDAGLVYFGEVEERVGRRDYDSARVPLELSLELMREGVLGLGNSKPQLSAYSGMLMIRMIQLEIALKDGRDAEVEEAMDGVRDRYNMVRMGLDSLMVA